MPGKHKFLVVEGANGAGKSTLSRALREWLDGVIFHYTPEFERLRNDIQLDLKVAPVPRSLVYLAATMHVSDLVRHQLPYRDVICDRYIASPMALMLTDGSMTEQQLAEVYAPFESYCCRPDLTILLTIDHETAKKRILERAEGNISNIRGTQRRIIDSAAFLDRWHAQLKGVLAGRGSVTEIDVSGKSADEVLVAALAAIEDRLGRRVV